MNSRHQILANEIEENVDKLLDQLKVLKEENKRINSLLKQKNEELKQSHRDILNLRDDLRVLESAQGISGTGNPQLSIQYLNSLVREVDKCLTLLKL